MRGLIEAGRVDTAHDVSDGGLLVAIAEMAMAGNIGAEILISGTPKSRAIAEYFGEDQGRYLLAVPKGDADDILGAAKTANVIATTHRHDWR